MAESRIKLNLACIVLLWLLVDAEDTSKVADGSLNNAKDFKERVLLSRMSTKTVYPVPQPSDQDLQRVLYNDRECHPIQLNFVIRHGTRFPTGKDITRMARTHDTLLHGLKHQSLQQRQRFQWIFQWKMPYDMSAAGWLADAGVQELVAMGQRFRARFGIGQCHHDAQHCAFSHEKFVIQHTYKPRTHQSASSFAFGFFDGHQQVHYQTVPATEDYMLRFFDNCQLFERQVEKNTSAMVEFSMFRDSSLMRKALDKFRSVLQMPTLTQKEMEAAYAACAFDVAVRGILDQWCSLFDESMLLTFDYFHDLKNFYRKSHGHRLAYEIASPLLGDLLETMQRRIDKDTEVEGIFRFAHAETLLPLISLINADQQRSKLRASSENLHDRDFWGSEWSPFGGNIGFVLHECEQANRIEQEGSEDDDDSGQEPGQRVFVVQMLLNENVVPMAFCDHQFVCPFDRLRQHFEQEELEEFHLKCQNNLS